MLQLLTNKYTFGFLGTIAIFIAVITYGQKQYNSGYADRDLKAKVEIELLKNDILQKATEERNRQLAANRKARDLQDKQIQELEQLNEELEQTLKENENAAKLDDNHDRIGLDPSSVMRLDSIK